MNEKGSALLLAMILSLLLMALGLGITLSGISEFSMSSEFESHDKALFVADAGLGAAEADLKGRNLSQLLQESTSMPLFRGQKPLTGRDPIAINDARDIDFTNPPEPVAFHEVTGMLTPSMGTTMARGRYFAKVSDNDDGDGDPTVDQDGVVYVRTYGIYPGPPQEIVLNGSNKKNSVSIVERMLKRDTTFHLSSPFSVYGEEAIPAQNSFFDGSSFLIDGHDHSSQSVTQVLTGGHNHRSEESDSSGISVINDDPTVNDAEASLDSIYEEISKTQSDNIIGAEGPYGSTPSIRDDTETIRDSNNPDATNIFNPEFLSTLVDRVATIADTHYEEDATLSGGNITLGTEDSPQITVASGNLDLAGGGSGSGLLIVKGALNYSGSFDFNGLILIVGEGSVNFSGANKSIVGGIYVTNIQEDANGDHYFGTPSFTLSGRTNFYFRGESIRMAVSLLPLRGLSWREITREMIPVQSVSFETTGEQVY